MVRAAFVVTSFPVFPSHKRLELRKTLEIISLLQGRRLRPREGGDLLKVIQLPKSRPEP